MCINGVGFKKWDKFGVQFLQAIEEYVRLHKIQKPKSRFEPSVSISKNQSAQISYGYFQSGKSIDDIAKVRQMTRSTIVGHLVCMIEQGKQLDIDKAVLPEKQVLIKKIVEIHGKACLKVLKEQLPEEITYDEIRLSLAMMDY